mmetsp:Transcript_10258/g.30963  ORF Transcript_10258/g.30963 Transcript_10258/m.30963 type:complete len:155 (-) Transcript_10258:158-622(-)|eukprot:CAMPEP_0198662742 /NCGR_PEP_ID=MMETSP1467-20131203/49008_1 /TAXON_ID=1462469 /ORGANISM="unid. sp., Strain CCMP2135" /LENGTH=154 /DNA_ID=CAMNT_0044399245 /DNA_START=43 /DNA_END=507 /DNA_ORIENTATION=-
MRKRHVVDEGEDEGVRLPRRSRMEQDGLRILLRARAVRELQMKQLEMQLYTARLENERLNREFQCAANTYIDREFHELNGRVDRAAQTDVAGLHLVVERATGRRYFPPLRFVLWTTLLASVAAARLAFLLSDQPASLPRLRRLLLRITTAAASQ